MSMKSLILGSLAGFVIASSPVKAEEPIYRCEQRLDGIRQPVFSAMEEEFNRSKDKLRISGYADPFYMSFNVKVDESEVATGSFGSSAVKNKKTILVRPELKIGSYEDEVTAYTSIEVPSAEPYALKRALWITADLALKKAEAGYYNKKAAEISKVKDKSDNTGDFSRESPTVCMGNDTRILLDKDLEGIVKRASMEIDNEKNVMDSYVVLSGFKTTNYLLNSEGTKIVTSSVYYSASVTIAYIADDGERLGASRAMHYRTPNELPSERDLKKLIKDALDEIRMIKAAPYLGPAAVPAILDSDNSGVFFHEVIGHRLEGERQTNPTSGGTFKGKVGEKVAPDIVTLVDDPTMASFKGLTLNGHYQFDEEGIAAQRVSLIEKGVLKGYLKSRSPVPGFAKSNGHGRTEKDDPSIARMGNTMLAPERVVPFEELKKMAAEEATKQGKDFYLIFRSSIGGLTSPSGLSDYQAFKVIPKLVYKVDVKTGKETLVKPVEVVGTPLSMLTEIAAFGDDSRAWNGFCGAESGRVPVSVIAPSMLVRKVEVQNSTLGTWAKVLININTPPILPPPKK